MGCIKAPRGQQSLADTQPGWWPGSLSMPWRYPREEMQFGLTHSNVSTPTVLIQIASTSKHQRQGFQPRRLPSAELLQQRVQAEQSEALHRG